MNVVVRLTPVPRWWMWRPGADSGAVAAEAKRRARRGRARVLLPAAVPLAGALAVLGTEPWWAAALFCAPFALVGLVLLVPPRVAEWDVVKLAREQDVVHFEQFPLEQRRRARRLCEHFLAVDRTALDPARVERVERSLWQALVALRDSGTVREALAKASNRPGLAAAIAETTRSLAELDRRLDQFGDALRILAEELDPELAGSALRRVAALDPI